MVRLRRATGCGATRGMLLPRMCVQRAVRGRRGGGVARVPPPRTRVHGASRDGPLLSAPTTRSFCISTGATCLDLERRERNALLMMLGNPRIAPGTPLDPTLLGSVSCILAFLRVGHHTGSFCCQCGRHSSCLSRPCTAIAWLSVVVCRVSAGTNKCGVIRLRRRHFARSAAEVSAITIRLGPELSF